ncbi:FAD:protein FMN transferase [Alteromonas sp. ASW11-19]|uniref:FAD:protein FMN transferase n=2 Tax=Alteromonas salexigens TaxID=2982530 RepID=A0ABT2VRX1_9ALTE|nr:FAD:protein FMN transferase [Alteromonas salexigens]
MAKWLGSILVGLVITVGAARADWYYDDAAIMGTNIEVQVWADTERAGQAAIDAVFAEMERVNQQMSPYIESSELSRLNASAATAPVVVSAELFALLRYAQQMSETSNGAFDITFASVGFHYDYRAQKRPSDEVIASQLAAVNYRHLELNTEQHSVFYAHPDVRIDLGGIAKGHAVDKAIEKLKRLGVEHAMVTAGGDTRLLGDRLGRPWLVGIRDPRKADRQAVKLPLSNTAISTSGDYERYFEEDGQRYHHILSPATGKSASMVQSVSVIGPSSTTNDALSTSVFVLGLEAGMALINSLPTVEAIILDNQRRMHFSAGLTDQ